MKRNNRRIMGHMEIRELEIYKHLSESLHFAHTSEYFFMSKSTLSRMIQRLEDEVGTPLFERDTREVRLTQAGIYFAQFATTVLEERQAVQKQIETPNHEITGTITIACSITASDTLLPRILKNFKKKYPYIQVNLDIGDVERTQEKVLSGIADFGITILSGTESNDLLTKQISVINLVLVGSKKHHPRNVDLNTTPVILPKTGNSRRIIENWFVNQNIKINVHSQVAGFEGILALIKLGYGVGLVPDLVYAKSPQKKKLFFKRMPNKNLPILLAGMCTQKSGLDTIEKQVFWDSLQTIRVDNVI